MQTASSSSSSSVARAAEQPTVRSSSPSISRPAAQAAPDMEDAPGTTTTATTSPTTPPGSSSTAAASGSSVQWSSNTDASTHAPLLVALLAPGGGRWAVSGHGRGVERTLRFRTFRAAWAFMDGMAAECKKERHHPEWANAYNIVHVRWTTHSPLGLSMKDLKMARLCDEKAAEQGEQVGDEVAKGGKDGGDVKSQDQGGGGGGLGELVDVIAADACEACAPKENKKKTDKI